MSKTNFIDGSFLTPNFMGSIYGQGADEGHFHDGQLLDGHARVIDIVTETKGILPINRVGGVTSRGYIDGYIMSYNVDVDANSITIAAGSCVDTSGTIPMVRTAPITKKVTDTGMVYLPWAFGDSNGGVATAVGAPVNKQWLHVFIISDGTNIDAGFDTSITASNLMTESGYLYYRRVGSILMWQQYVNKSRIFRFKQFGDEFVFTDSTAVIYGNQGLPGTITAFTNYFSPKDLVVKTEIKMAVNTVNGLIPGGQISAGDIYATLWSGFYPSQIGYGGVYVYCPVNGRNSGTGFLYCTENQIFYGSSGAAGQTPGMAFWSTGYTDLRGKNV